MLAEYQALNFSYKKLGSANSVHIGEAYTIAVKNSVRIIEWFKSRSSKVVYVDEFSINRKTTNLYGWTPKNVSGWKVQNPQSFHASFVIGFSQHGVEGLMGFKGTITSKSFVYFLKRLLQRLRSHGENGSEQVVVVCDN